MESGYTRGNRAKNGDFGGVLEAFQASKYGKNEAIPTFLKV